MTFPKAWVLRTGVAVLGTVPSKRSYATPDDRDIYTDFEIAPEDNPLMQRAVIISARSGPPAPMVFKTLGGTGPLSTDTRLRSTLH